MKFNFPLDTNGTQFADWAKGLKELIENCLASENKDLEEAKASFGSLSSFFPNIGNLNEIDSQEMFVGESSDKAWNTFSRLLYLWMDLQEETLPGAKSAVDEQEFVNVLRLTDHALTELIG